MKTACSRLTCWRVLQRHSTNVNCKRTAASFICRNEVTSASQAPLRCAMQFHAHEAVNALKFRYQSLHAESNKWREIEWKRLLPALMEKRVVLDIVLIEVVRECVKAVAVISPLKEDACSN